MARSPAASFGAGFTPPLAVGKKWKESAGFSSVPATDAVAAPDNLAARLQRCFRRTDQSISVLIPGSQGEGLLVWLVPQRPPRPLFPQQPAPLP